MPAHVPEPQAGSPLARLLARLDAHPDAAADAFEDLRRVLVRFFDWRGVHTPEECADETLDRLARRLDEGEAIVSIRAYAYAIAKLVRLEHSRKPESRAFSLDAVPEALLTVEPPLESPRLACLDRCLDDLPGDARTLITRYYAHDRQRKIDDHAAQARELGISLSALHNRVQRLRDKLARCVGGCVERRADSDRRPSSPQTRHDDRR